jgi:hypothetical protein
LPWALTATRGADPFEFVQPSIRLAQEDRSRLDGDEPVARILPSRDGEIAVFAAVRVAVDGNRLVTWVRRIDDLKRSSYVPAIGRVSEPPRIEDLADLELDDEDLADVRACRPQKLRGRFICSGDDTIATRGVLRPLRMEGSGAA